MAEDAVVLEGYSRFVKDTREAPQRVSRAYRGVFRAGAQRLIARAAIFAPRRTGAMAEHTSIRVGPKSVTVTWTEPYAPVQEFARQYTRQTASGDSQTVHMTQGEPPRFAYKAWNQMQKTFGQEILKELEKAVAESGFWEVV